MGKSLMLCEDIHLKKRRRLQYRDILSATICKAVGQGWISWNIDQEHEKLLDRRVVIIEVR